MNYFYTILTVLFNNFFLENKKSRRASYSHYLPTKTNTCCGFRRRVRVYSGIFSSCTILDTFETPPKYTRPSSIKHHRFYSIFFIYIHYYFFHIYVYIICYFLIVSRLLSSLKDVSMYPFVWIHSYIIR